MLGCGRDNNHDNRAEHKKGAEEQNGRQFRQPLRQNHDKENYEEKGNETKQTLTARPACK